MSTSLTAIGKQLIIYCGIPIFITGVVGDFLNILVFLSLQTFRQSSCAFYLTIMSIFNIGQLCFGLFALRVMNTLIGVDGTETSLFYCKFRVYLAQLCVGGSLTCFCLATIDQYFATCSRPRWVRFCSIKLAHCLVIINVLTWMIHGIPFSVYYNHVRSPITNKVICSISNTAFTNYLNYFFVLVFIGYFPIVIGALFGWLAYRNVQQISHRAIPLARRELDKQLTTMVLLQVLVNILILLPYTTINAVSTNTTLMNDSVVQANFQFSLTIFVIIYHIYFSSPFYIYICVSERFRKQFLYVLSKISIYRWKQPRIGNNQVIPET